MIKVDKKLNVKYKGIKKDVMKQFSKLVASLRRDLSEEDLEECLKVGFEAYEKFGKPRISTFEINASNKEEALKQLKRMELPQDVEKAVYNILNKK